MLGLLELNVHDHWIGCQTDGFEKEYFPFLYDLSLLTIILGL
jgi:hypothetical protein